MVKATMRWRTALVVQELEAEVAGLAAGKQQRDDLERLLRHKVRTHSRVKQRSTAAQRRAAQLTRSAAQPHWPLRQ
jgi:uncharacterized membrane protein